MRNKKALVMSYSVIKSDPRVLRQVEWLISDGWSIDTIGLGEPISRTEDSHHFELGLRPLFMRLMTYVFFSGSLRFKYLVGKKLPKLSSFEGTKYQLVIANDLDLLPWCRELFESGVATTTETRWHLDLHEFFGDQGHGTVWKILFRKYQRWIFSYTRSDLWTTRSTVADGIANMYEEYASFSEMKIIKNTPVYSGLSPHERTDEKIRLIYHGKADLDRGLEDLISSVPLLSERYELHLMLMGSNRTVKKLRRLVEEMKVQSRVFFHPPVEVQNIPRAINEFDLEMVFFPPVTKNLLHALPNKFFEAIQGCIGVVIGDSPNMRGIVEREEIGLVVDGWTKNDLIDALNSLKIENVKSYRLNAAEAAKKYNSEHERSVFLSEIANAAIA